MHRVKPPVLAPGALDDSWRKEDFSIAYVHAVASACGVSCDHERTDINGWDVNFAARDTADADALQLNAQLKCTVNRLTRIHGGQTLSFKLAAADYNNLRKIPAHPPRLLVVVEARHARDWVRLDTGRLSLLGGAYFLSLAGAPGLPDGQQNRNVQIPARQRFTPSSLLANMCSCP